MSYLIPGRAGMQAASTKTLHQTREENAMKYPLLPRQSIEYNVLHALEVGYTGASDIETYLRDSGKVIYPRQVSGALQRLKRDGLAAHKNKHERDRWKLVPNAGYTPSGV